MQSWNIKMVFNISTQNPPKNAFSMPSNAVFPMPPVFGIELILNAVGIANAVTSIVLIEKQIIIF